MASGPARPARCSARTPSSSAPWPTMFVHCAIQFMAACVKSREERYPIPSMNTNATAKSAAAPRRFIRAAMTMRPLTRLRKGSGST